MKLVKLSKLAKDLNITKNTLYNWRLQGKIQFVQSKTGMNFVTLDVYNELMGIKEKKEENVIIYCRVSSSENKSNLETQKQRLINYCNAKGYKVSKVVEEIASGINDNRPKLSKILLDNNYTKIVVEHKDRLTRTGFNYLNILTQLLHKEIEVVNNITEEKEDLIQDFISIITSYCARIYGPRRSKRNTEKLIQELSKNV
jgi:predicted site-specific integrase-resolvase